ncbi:MAG: hypothetical protein IPK16_11340 [Anaerolineales bacterium]|nr:hypothetical protein [Anaerolineales bacterium]
MKEQYPSLNNPWKGHPFNQANNINGVNGDVNGDDSGSDTHTLANPQVTQYQEAFVKKVIDTVGDLDNVIFEISNESPDNSIQWQYHMIDVIKAHEATKAKQHPVGMSDAMSGTSICCSTAAPTGFRLAAVHSSGNRKPMMARRSSSMTRITCGVLAAIVTGYGRASHAV